MSDHHPIWIRAKGTSADSADLLGDFVLEEPGWETQETRKVLRLQWVHNKRDADAPVRGYILHQRRPAGTDTWLDIKCDLRRVRQGEEVSFELRAHHVKKLLEAFGIAYRLYDEHGLPRGDRAFTAREVEDDDQAREATDLGGVYLREMATLVQARDRLLTTADEGSLDTALNHLGERLVTTWRLERLQKIEQEHGQVFWDLIAQMSGNLPQAIAWQRIQQVRAEALATFQFELDRLEWSEGDWQVFFQQNTWIFGYGLNYRFTHLLQREAVVASADYQGRDEQRTDYLLTTAGDVRFTVVVDIKTPHADLVGATAYRNRAYRVSNEVSGGVAQVQAYCRTWATEGAQNLQNARPLEAQQVFTAEPKGILVIGRLASLQNRDDVQRSADARQSFESYRRNLHNPEIITFDELLERARYIVQDPDPYAR